MVVVVDLVAVEDLVVTLVVVDSVNVVETVEMVGVLVPRKVPLEDAADTEGTVPWVEVVEVEVEVEMVVAKARRLCIGRWMKHRTESARAFR